MVAERPSSAPEAPASRPRQASSASRVTGWPSAFTAPDQQLVGIAELDADAIRRNQLAGSGIELPEAVSRAEPYHAALHGADGQCHLLELHGLDEAYVRPGGDDLAKHLGAKAPGNNHDARLGAAAQDLDQLGAPHAGQHQVDQVELRSQRPGVGQQRIAVVEAAHRDARLRRSRVRYSGVVEVASTKASVLGCMFASVGGPLACRPLPNALSVPELPVREHQAPKWPPSSQTLTE